MLKSKLRERREKQEDKKVERDLMAMRALTMHRYGASYSEIAEALGIKESSVRRLLKHSMKYLKNNFKVEILIPKTES